MGFWEFIAMLGSPAKTSKMERAVERIGKIADSISDSNHKENSMMSMLEEAERNMRNDRKQED